MEALAAQDIYELGERVEPFILADGTRMGHIHLSVKDSRKSSQFYQKVLGLEDKFSVPSASWIAAGGLSSSFGSQRMGEEKIWLRVSKTCQVWPIMLLRLLVKKNC